MNVNVNAMLEQIKEQSGIENSFEQREIIKTDFELSLLQQKAEALKYLRVKFPDLEEKVFFTDYDGQKFDNIIGWQSVYKAAIFDKSCTDCKGICKLPESLKSLGGKPIVSVCENKLKGFKYLDVRWTCGIKCKFDPLSGLIGRMFRKSGLSNAQFMMNFEDNPELSIAKKEAFNALNEQKCLILLGNCAKKKTDLAVAIAIKTIKNGKQAIFRTIVNMLDEIERLDLEAEAKLDKLDFLEDEDADISGYFEIMKAFNEVFCLVIDGLNDICATKRKWMSYLYSIIDYRYIHKLQTVITINADNYQEVESWENGNYVAGIVSRLLENGKCIILDNK